jgi:hypothetical protein
LDNVKAIDLITKHVYRQLNDRGLNLKSEVMAMEWQSKPLPESVTLVQHSSFMSVRFQFF